MQPLYISSVSAIFILIVLLLFDFQNFAFFCIFYDLLLPGRGFFLEFIWLLDEDNLSVECHSIKVFLIL